MRPQTVLRAAFRTLARVAVSWDNKACPKWERQHNYFVVWLFAYLDRAERQRTLLAAIDPAVLERAASLVADEAEMLEATWKGIRDWEGQEERQDAAALRAYAARLREVGE